MNEFAKQCQELRDFLTFDEYTILIKRIIDLTLDTQNLEFYHKTNKLLNWLDTNETNDEAKKEHFSILLEELISYLENKPISEYKILLETKNLVKQYNHSNFGLGPIDLQLHQGQILGLVGENGNGKTTLLRLLCGELYATSGKIEYNFSYTDVFELRTNLVYIPQRTDTWYGSMFENLQFTASSYGYSAEENEVLVELIIARLGLRKFRKYRWRDLSSGYKMRFELARMLLRKPKILLIDEPLANLDILAQQTILEDFKAIAKSLFRPIGIILSSQQLYEVEKTSDQVIFLKQGKQKNLHDTVSNNNDQEELQIVPLVVEFECEASQSELTQLFQELELTSLHFNGGTFIATFPGKITLYQFLQIIISNKLQVLYFRNISNSTRRFFVSQF
jgi:ABC-2 type transport system ATP-binding protein